MASDHFGVFHTRGDFCFRYRYLELQKVTFGLAAFFLALFGCLIASLVR